MEKSKTYEQLLNELKEMRLRLEEANDTLEAIRTGEVDALVVKGEDGHEIYTLKSADQTYRIFIEQMTEGAITLNPGGYILYANSRFAELIGLSLEKVIGQPLFNFIEQGEVEKYKIVLARAWKDKVKTELHLKANNESSIPVLISLKTLDLDEGRSMSIIITDLSIQKRNEQLLQEKNIQLEEAERLARDLNNNLEKTVRKRTEELKKNQEQLSRVLETMAEGVGIVDANGKLTYANPMAQKILGLKEHKIKERTYHDPRWQNLRLDGTDLPEKEHPMYLTMTTGQPIYDFEIGIRPPDREVFYISINAAPILDDYGNILGGIGTFMDVTHRRKHIQQKDDFISVASHELKTPITSLKASLQLLNRIKGTASNEMMPVLIQQANKSMDKVTSLINDLLNAGKYTEGQLHLNKSHFNLMVMVRDSFRNFHSENSHIILVEGEENAQIFADADRIEQVVVNFVNNALKYAPASREIKVRIEKTGKEVKLSVTDQGPGIAKEKLPYIFERYYRVDEKGSQYSGLGLGLYISAGIIKKHGGQIGADSKAGKGSTFWFSLSSADV